MNGRVATVTSSNGKRQYAVSLKSDEWQCACIGWTRHVPRKDCKHIRGCKSMLEGRSTKLDITWYTIGMALGPIATTRSPIKTAGSVKMAEVRRVRKGIEAEKAQVEKTLNRSARDAAIAKRKHDRLLAEQRVKREKELKEQRRRERIRREERRRIEEERRVKAEAERKKQEEEAAAKAKADAKAKALREHNPQAGAEARFSLLELD